MRGPCLLEMVAFLGIYERKKCYSLPCGFFSRAIAGLSALRGRLRLWSLLGVWLECFSGTK